MHAGPVSWGIAVSLHRVVSRPIAWLVGSLWLLAAPAFAQSAYFFPQGGDFDPSIPTPQQFLGYEIGSRYTRHDQLVAYFDELARHSDKIKVERIGTSYEGRPLLIATVTSAQNHQQLETLRRQHVTLADPAQPLSAAGNSPVVVWLGYSVHGNETSSGEAALLTAYYLVANRSADTAQWLDRAVVLFDPAQNPDGRDRAASWHNAYASSPASADPADKEHVEPFPQGRTNHYFTDLNRDWLALTQQDTRPKIAYFHRWYPNVQIDFHEMGKDSTYYFEPSPASMHSPLIPAASYAFNRTLARYHAQALDALGSLYYTGENFDNFSPVYGSTYPDFHGAVGVTVEQASSRGRVQESVNGLLTFPFTIRNQVATGLGTVRGAVTERDGLIALQKDFFQSALTQAGQQPVKAFVFGDAHDPGLTARLLDLLLQHRITVQPLTAAVTVDGQRFLPGSAYVVPTAQPQFRLVHSIFADTPPIKGDVFYGSTSYAIAPAYGVAFAGSRSRLDGGPRITAVAPAQGGREWRPGRLRVRARLARLQRQPGVVRAAGTGAEDPCRLPAVHGGHRRRRAVVRARQRGDSGSRPAAGRRGTAGGGRAGRARQWCAPVRGGQWPEPQRYRPGQRQRDIAAHTGSGAGDGRGRQCHRDRIGVVPA